MLRHGLTPDGMLNGNVVPIPNGRQANLLSSGYFRAITLSSMLCKLLDVIILTKDEVHLCTSNLQFGFKQGSSTSLCTAMVQEIISYYVYNVSEFYWKRNYVHCIEDCFSTCAFNQKLRVRWESTHSPYFNFYNSVTQGGIISLILFCIYMDGLLCEFIIVVLGVTWV